MRYLGSIISVGLVGALALLGCQTPPLAPSSASGLASIQVETLPLTKPFQSRQDSQPVTFGVRWPSPTGLTPQAIPEATRLVRFTVSVGTVSVTEVDVLREPGAASTSKTTLLFPGEYSVIARAYADLEVSGASLVLADGGASFNVTEGQGVSVPITLTPRPSPTPSLSPSPTPSPSPSPTASPTPTPSPSASPQQPSPTPQATPTPSPSPSPSPTLAPSERANYELTADLWPTSNIKVPGVTFTMTATKITGYWGPLPSFSAVTDSKGVAKFTLRAPGTYRLTANHPNVKIMDNWLAGDINVPAQLDLGLGVWMVEK